MYVRNVLRLQFMLFLRTGRFLKQIFLSQTLGRLLYPLMNNLIIAGEEDTKKECLDCAEEQLITAIH